MAEGLMHMLLTSATQCPGQGCRRIEPGMGRTPH